MPDIALAAEARAERGSSSSRRTRTDGRIPAVIYGHGIDPLAVTIDARELRGALNAQSGGSVLFNVNLGKDQHLVIAREVQRHPIRHTVAHVDFQIVRRDEIISATVAINLVGETTKVTRAGGIVEQALLHVQIHGKPADIPAVIEVDVEQLEIGMSIRVADLTLPAGLSVDVDPETPVVVAAAPHGVDLGEAAAEEALAGAEESTEAAAEESTEAESSDESSDES
jgi:large subunit ribosomal protein L25